MRTHTLTPMTRRHMVARRSSTKESMMLLFLWSEPRKPVPQEDFINLLTHKLRHLITFREALWPKITSFQTLQPLEACPCELSARGRNPERFLLSISGALIPCTQVRVIFHHATQEDTNLLRRWALLEKWQKGMPSGNQVPQRLRILAEVI